MPPGTGYKIRLAHEIENLFINEHQKMSLCFFTRRY